MGAMGLGLAPRPPFSPAQSPGGGIPNYAARPNSRASPITQGQGRPSSRPSSSEVPIVREMNPNQPGGNAIDFSAQNLKPYPQYLGREGQGQPKRPSSTLSEPGVGHRALSPHIQTHLMMGKLTNSLSSHLFLNK